MSVTLSASIFAALTAITILFQLGLALGMPWAQLAWGGKYTGVLPKNMRMASLFAIGLLLLFATIVLIRAGLIWPDWQGFGRIAIWFVVAYSALGMKKGSAANNTVLPFFTIKYVYMTVINRIFSKKRLYSPPFRAM